jgi:general secretion pathway protein K
VRSQRGVALLTALLVVFVATVAGAQLVYQLQLTINRSGAILGQRQAWYYALGGESWAAEILRRDAEDNDFDAQSEDWAKPITALPIEGGTISGTIVDLDGRFDLNSLIDAEGKAVEATVNRFKRLLQVLELDESIAAAVVDWLDSDSETGFPGGAEATEYLARDPAYRSADGTMASASELWLVMGVDAAAYNVLSEHVTVLPASAPINVNTASVPVLMALNPGIERLDAESLRADAKEDGFESIQDFVGHEAIRQLELPAEGLSVASNFFLVNSEVKTEYGSVTLQSLLQRDKSGQTRVVARSLGTPI